MYTYKCDNFNNIYIFKLFIYFEKFSPIEISSVILIIYFLE